MKNIRLLIPVLMVLFAGYGAQAQTDSAPANSSGKKAWYLTLGIDQKVHSISGNYKSVYEGEYNDGQPFGATSWTWKRKETEIKDVLKWSSFYSTKIDMLLSRNQKFKAGLSYNFGAVVYQDTALNYLNLSFIAITGLGEYDYYLKKDMHKSPFVFGSLAAGFYRESAYTGGPGRELFSEFRGGVGYRTQKDWIFRVWAAGNYLNYREHTNSPVFNREQTRKVDMRLAYWGIGFFRQFELIPE